MAKDKVYTEDMGQPPTDPEVAPRTPKAPKKDMPEQLGSSIKVQKMAKGGTASSRADGCATKGKTKGKIV